MSDHEVPDMPMPLVEEYEAGKNVGYLLGLAENKERIADLERWQVSKFQIYLVFYLDHQGTLCLGAVTTRQSRAKTYRKMILGGHPSPIKVWVEPREANHLYAGFLYLPLGMEDLEKMMDRGHEFERKTHKAELKEKRRVIKKAAQRIEEQKKQIAELKRCCEKADVKIADLDRLLSQSHSKVKMLEKRVAEYEGLIVNVRKALQRDVFIDNINVLAFAYVDFIGLKTPHLDEALQQERERLLLLTTDKEYEFDLRDKCKIHIHEGLPTDMHENAEWLVKVTIQTVLQELRKAVNDE